MTYEIMRVGADPFDIMCSDCPVHEIEWWESATLEELHDLHNEELAEDASMLDMMGDEVRELQQRGEWHPANPDFDEWLKQRIEEGYIRTAA